MNYAWGLEFVELTAGTKEDRENANGIPDQRGFHGNAFLTKCAISDPIIFRNEVGPYFSSKPNSVNANGTEKRLGGRMGLFGRIVVDGESVVIGSVHKLEWYEDKIKEYIGPRDAIIAGDQNGRFCDRWGLKNVISTTVGDQEHFTWPATCNSNGHVRGDN